MLCSYWGSDSGGRVFDVLVNETKVATQTLDNNEPGHFFDAVCAIPEELTRGKEKVTVRFQAHAGRTAGGVFGCRIIRRSESNAPSD